MKPWHAASALIASILLASNSFAATTSVNIQDDGYSTNSPELGFFNGSFSFDDSTSKLTISITNDSSVAVNIVGIAFDYPNSIVSGLTLSSPASGWQVDSAVSASPFDTVDALISTDGSFNGGGSGAGGITPGSSLTFVLNVGIQPTHAATELTASSFLTEGIGKDQILAVRFQGTAGSDKVGGTTVPGVGATPTPLPAAAWGGTSLIGALYAGRKLRRRRA